MRLKGEAMHYLIWKRWEYDDKWTMMNR